jgi:hypothetical protein
MQTTWKVTPADRDEQGSIKVATDAPAEPRSLAELLPTPENIKQEAARVVPQHVPSLPRSQRWR